MSSLSSNVTIRAPRRCGHCREFGHNIITCIVLSQHMNVLFHSAMEKVQNDVLENQNGGLFEKWVIDLEQNDLKYLVWKITNTRGSYEPTHNFNIIFEYFDSLNMGYISQKNRRVRNYFKVYRQVLKDVANHANGVQLDHFLKNMMSENDVDNVFFKISTNSLFEDRIPGDNQTSLREFDNWYSQPTLMSHRHFVIHCHFAELGIGYDFRIRNIPGYILPRSQPREQNYVRRIRRRLSPPDDHPVHNIQEDIEQENPSNTGSINISLVLKTDLLRLTYTRNSAYPIQIQMDYDLLKLEKMDDSSSDMCAICMETKEKKTFLTTECNHDFCNVCIGQMMVNSIVQSKSLDCPLCRKQLKKFKYSDVTTIRNIIPTNVELSQSTLNSISI